MEQYYMPKKMDFKNLRLCLDNYEADFLFIRDCGGYNPDGSYRMHGLTKVSENLEGKTLDFRKGRSGLHFLIDDAEVFHFPLKDRGTRQGNGFSLAYERFEQMDSYERIILLSTGINPYDPKLPEPRRSFLRHIIDNHLLEIFFKGRIPLKFHSWWQEPHWKYWTVTKDKPKE